MFLVEIWDVVMFDLLYYLCQVLIVGWCSQQVQVIWYEYIGMDGYFELFCSFFELVEEGQMVIGIMEDGQVVMVMLDDVVWLVWNDELGKVGYGRCCKLVEWSRYFNVFCF